MWKRLKRLIGSAADPNLPADARSSEVGAEPDKTVQSLGYENWVCPFCGKTATLETKQRSLCESKTCPCGAIGLAAPTVDTDEIIDDALGMFSVQIREESIGLDARMLDDLARAGFDIREGERTRILKSESRCE